MGPGERVRPGGSSVLGTLCGLLLSSCEKVRGARLMKFNSQVFIEHLTRARCWVCKGDLEDQELTFCGELFEDCGQRYKQRGGASWLPAVTRVGDK